jgi:hypothetical protein
MGLSKTLLPLGTTDASNPHVPIFVSADICSRSRVVVIFGETMQDLGVLAHRVANGPGGVTHGSMVGVVAQLQKQRSSATDPSPPGVILANTGELLWWPGGSRALCRSSFFATPMRSAAHEGIRFDRNIHTVPGNRDVDDHVRYIFETVVPAFVDKEAGIDVVGVGDGAIAVLQYFDSDGTWTRLKDRIRCFVNAGGLHPSWELRCEELRDEFLPNV